MTALLEAGHWDAQYRRPGLPWETGQPATELRRVVAGGRVSPCRALELGCGTGASAVWLARQGFAVTAIDLSPLAVRRARRRAARAGVRVDLVAGNLIDSRALTGPYDFFFDSGCYGVVRLADPAGYLATLTRVTRPGSLGLVLVGNDGEPEDDVGPPVVSAALVRSEFGGLFEILRLRACRFDAPRPHGRRYLAWSCLMRRRG